MPLISIIVPVYNLELYIKKCIDSILAQTFTNFEVIVVNDGSTDNSGDICDEYAQKDNRVVVVHKKNDGLSSARNTGIKISRGKYLGFVDGDDWIYDDMYEKLYTLSNQNNCDIAICNIYREIKGEVNYIERAKLIKEMDNIEAMRQLFKGILYRFSVCNKLYKKSCFRGIEFPEGRLHEDLSTTYKLFSNANKVVFTNYTGYIYVKRENSILNSRYNPKRLESFIAWNEILSFMNIKYPQLSEEYYSCFVYWCIDHIYQILNQIDKKVEQERYLVSIQLYLQKYYKAVIILDTLSLKYKYLITCLNYNFKLLLFTNSMKKQLRKIRTS